MTRIDQLLNLLDKWDEADAASRGNPEEFCKDQVHLLDDFVRVLRQRGVISALLMADNSPAIRPESMVDRMQSGRFPVVQFHDKGGLGWVYLAKDQELKRTVALKCLQPGPATDPLARERFIREAEITARLEHPGIVPIYGLGGIPMIDSPYYTMRFIQGETLRHAISTLHSMAATPDWRSLQAIRLLRAFVTVCETIAFAHSKSVIHRDLKSSNIMLGAYGETLVLDWGLARTMNEAADLQETHADNPQEAACLGQVTQAGATFGTLGFMSPEQAQGDWSRVGPSADIFSLGAILYQMLTNQTAYQGDGALAQARSCRFQSPSEVNSGVPKSLEAICLKAMQREPSLRYPSAIDLKQDVELFLADEQITARRDSVIERTNRWIRKHRGVVQLSGWMGLATIVMLSVFLSLTAEKNRQLEESGLRERQAKEELVAQRDRANEELRRTIHESYAANMAQVSQALTDRAPRLHTEALMRSLPRIGSPIDPRGPEWWLNWGIAYGNSQLVPYGDILCAKLVDEGRKSAIWTAENELRIVDHASGKTQFTKVLKHVSIRKPRYIPISADGTTVAVPYGTLLQVYRTSGTSFDLIAELDMNPMDERVLDEIALSNNGSVIAIVSIEGIVRAWDLASNTPFQSLSDLGRVYGPRLSANGRFLAFYQDELPVVFELITGARISLEPSERREFHGLAFGPFETLVIWSNSRAMTLGIDLPRQLTPLWETPLPCPPSLADSQSMRIERDIMEWIVLDKASQGQSNPHLNGRLNSGNQPAEVHATILLALGSTGTQMFYREPGGTYPRNLPSYDSSAQPDRIIEFTSPYINEIVDTTVDGAQFLLRRGKSEHLVVPRSKLMSEIVDVHPHRGEIKRLAWVSADELLSLSQGTTNISRTKPGSQDFVYPEVNRLNTRTSTSLPPQNIIAGAQATVSSDGKVLASFGNERFRVRDGSHGPNDYQFQVELPERLFDNGTVNLFAWNRFDKQPVDSLRAKDNEFEEFINGHKPELVKPIDLPWILVFQNEMNRDVARAVDKVTTQLFIIDYQQSRLVQSIEIPLAYVQSVAIRPDGREFAVGSNDQIVRAWKIADDQSITRSWEQKLPMDAVCMCYQDNSSLVAAGNAEGDVYLIGPGSRNDLYIPKAHESAITVITYSASGDRILTTGVDNTVRMFDTVGSREMFKYSLQHTPTCVELSQHANSLAIGDAAGHIVVLPKASMNDVWQIAKEKFRVPELASQAKDLVLRELWAEYVRARNRSDEEIEMAIAAIESVRGRLEKTESIDQLRLGFRLAFPPGFR